MSKVLDLLNRRTIANAYITEGGTVRILLDSGVLVIDADYVEDELLSITVQLLDKDDTIVGIETKTFPYYH